MAKKNNDFFVEKKAWSVVKDELLGCYFMPYVSKILHTGRPLVYVDCFAGKGKFDDGTPGSPLIALEAIDDLIEYDPSKMNKSSESIDELNAIAGGDYWTRIIDQYKVGAIDGYEAETRFAEQYCQRLRQNYKYVLNMPLRIKKGQRPKYRLISSPIL